ncbi:MAG: transglycosylase SLT domain-containing protein [Candidatus Thiodiazotropha sp. (ex Lucinoma borealis)]|nr:transglycosylase SLT domain-containing protein [Candidatus Thiodiazotropha sp. (ex Lucinoma borealis)]
MVWLRWHKSWLIVLVSFILPSASWSGELVPAGYRAIAAERDVPQSVLYAVALTESGKRVALTEVYRPWPWTLNVAGRGYFFDSRQEAWQALMEHLKEGKRSIDIGLMQVNWHYHQDRLGTPWQALDPYHNLRVGAEILQDCYVTRLDWWASVGCYHAPANPRRADRYRRHVVSRWQRIVSAG